MVVAIWVASAVLALLPDAGRLAPGLLAVASPWVLAVLATASIGGRSTTTDLLAPAGAAGAAVLVVLGYTAPAGLAAAACAPTVAAGALALDRDLRARGMAAATLLALAAELVVPAADLAGGPGPVGDQGVRTAVVGTVVVATLRATALLNAARSVTGGFAPARPRPLRRRPADWVLAVVPTLAVAALGAAIGGPRGAAPAAAAPLLLAAADVTTVRAHRFVEATTRRMRTAARAAGFAAAPSGQVIVDRTGAIVDANPAAQQLLGTATHPGRRLADLVEGAPLDLDALVESGSAGDVVTAPTGGGRRIVSITARPVGGPHLLAELRDVSRQRAELHLLERRAVRATKLGELIARGLAGDHEDDLRRAAVTFVQRELPGTRCRVEDRSPPDGPDPMPSTNGRWLFVDVPSGTGCHARLVVERHDGRLLDHADVTFVANVANVLALATERVRAVGRAKDALNNDQLTNLAGRPKFNEELARTLEAASRHGQPTTVLFLDLDGFKPVNDTFGHQLGDQLLAEVALRLRQAIRPGDMAGRLGGDEFAVLCPRLGADTAPSLASRLLEILHQPVLGPDGRPLDVSASVGVAVASPAVLDARTVLREADAAMYRAKHRGRGRYEITLV